MQTEIRRVENALQSTESPMQIARDCLANRQRRVDSDLVQDDAENQLLKVWSSRRLLCVVHFWGEQKNLKFRLMWRNFFLQNSRMNVPFIGGKALRLFHLVIFIEILFTLVFFSFFYRRTAC